MTFSSQHERPRAERDATRPGARLFAAIVLATLAGVPLILLPGVSFFFDITPKAVLLLIGAGAALWFPSQYLGGLSRLTRTREGKLFLALLAAQLISLALSTVFSTQPALSFSGSNWRRLGLATHGALLAYSAVLAGWLAAQGARLQWMLRAAVAAGLPAAAYGIVQYFGWDPLLPAEAYHVGEADWAIVRPPGTLGHAGYFATWLLHVVFFAAALAATGTQRGWRIAGGLTAGLAAAAIVLSGTRSAMLGLAAGLGLLMLRYRPLWNRRTAAAAAAVAVVLAGFYVSPAGSKLRSRMDWFADDARGGARLWLWQDSFRMAAGFWPAGAGLETFGNQYPRFQSAGLAKAYPNRYHESPHNIFLDALTAQGVPGLLVLAGLCWVAFRAWRFSGRKATVFVGAGFAAAAVSNLFLVFTVPTALYFYASLAALAATEFRGEERAPARAASRLWRARLAAAAVSLPLLVFGLQLAWADWKLTQVERLARDQQTRGAAGAYEEFRRIKPWGMSADLWFSRTMLSLAAESEGKRSLRAWAAGFRAARRAAVEAGDRPRALYNLAIFHSVRNDAGSAEAALRAAVEQAPRWYKPRWMLARLLSRTGRDAEAREEAELALELNGGRDAEVRETLEPLVAAGQAPAPRQP